MYSYIFHIMENYLYCIVLFLYKQHLGLNYERLHMVGLDDCCILQPRHLVRNRFGGTQDTISIQNLRSHSFACGSSQAMSHATKAHFAWCDLRQT
jgi:hypothetical protein